MQRLLVVPWSIAATYDGMASMVQRDREAPKDLPVGLACQRVGTPAAGC
jgi:hypothetical protein